MAPQGMTHFTWVSVTWCGTRSHGVPARLSQGSHRVVESPLERDSKPTSPRLRSCTGPVWGHQEESQEQSSQIHPLCTGGFGDQLSVPRRCQMWGRWQHLLRSCCGIAPKLSLSQHKSVQKPRRSSPPSPAVPEWSREVMAARNCIRPPRCLHKECCLVIKISPHTHRSCSRHWSTEITALPWAQIAILMRRAMVFAA